MNLSIAFCFAVVADVLVYKVIPARRRVARFAWMSIFFAAQTLLIVGLIGSPLDPQYKPKDLPYQFWLKILTCVWWGLAAREVIHALAMPAMIRRTALENKLLSDLIAASTYVCSLLAMMGFVFGLSLQGLIATSGIIAIVLGLALQSTLGDVFSGLSLSIAKPYRIGDEINLDGGAEGEVIEINWRSTHLKNGSNDVVIVPNSAIAKMRIQNHSAGNKRYSGSFTVAVDSRNEPEFMIETLRHISMTCPSALDDPAPSVQATEFKGDRITYTVYFSTATIASAGEVRSEFITQLYKRARPGFAQRVPSDWTTPRDLSDSFPVYLFPEKELLSHLAFFEPLSDAEKTALNEKIVRRHFKVGEQLLAQESAADSAHFIFSGIVQVTRQVTDGRVLNVGKLGPGDSFGEISLLTGLPAPESFVALTAGLLLELRSQDLKSILQSRPELLEHLCDSATRVQQFIAMFDKAAIQPAVMEQHDLLWRVRNFFRLTAEQRS